MPVEYVAARSVLLDAIEALGTQVSSAILVGAQAVYLRTGAGDFAVSPMTTDADLALNVDWVRDEPELYAAMMAAGFVAGTQPGSWRGRRGVFVDLMVVPHQSGRPGKSARAGHFPPHRKGVARIAPGLEPALIDHEPMEISAFDVSDRRVLGVRVAGPGALLVAKLIKIGERLEAAEGGRRNRVSAKDALDVLRLLRAVEVTEFVAGLRGHSAERHAAEVSAQAIEVLRAHSARPTSALPTLASQAVGEDPSTAASFVALASELTSALDS